MRLFEHQAIVIVSLVFANFILSLLIPSILQTYYTISFIEKLLLNFLIWVALANVEVMFYVNKIYSRRQKDLTLWETQNTTDARLSAIRKGFNEVLKEQKDTNRLFQICIEEMIIRLEKVVSEASSSNEILINQRHLDTTDTLLSCMNGSKTDIFRPVHFFEANEFFYGMHSTDYFHKVYDMKINKKINEIKRLMVYKDKKELEDVRSQKLIQFHANTDGFSYKLISRKFYNDILRDYNLQRTHADFGIYGERYIYFATTSWPEQIVGKFSQDKDTIDNYITFFEKCWNHKCAEELLELHKEPISIEELFANGDND